MAASVERTHIARPIRLDHPREYGTSVLGHPLVNVQ